MSFSIPFISLSLALCGGCGAATNEYVPAETDMTRYLFAERLALDVAPDRLRLRVLIDGAMKMPPWQQVLLGSSEISSPTLKAPSVFKIPSLMPLDSPPLCWYGVKGDPLATFVAFSDASFAAQQRGLDETDVFIVCPPSH